MPPTPSSSGPPRRAGGPSGRGRPTGGKPGGGGGKPGRSSSGDGRSGGRPSRSGAGDRNPRRDRDSGESEGPAWKRRADAREADDKRAQAAGWGGVARRGTGRLRDEGRSSGASQAFREASGREEWEPEVWIDEGVVRGEAAEAVGRGRSKRRVGPVDEGAVEADPSVRRAVAANKVERFEAHLKEASKAFRRDRFDEARKILRPLAESAPTAESVRELLGLTLYRLGRWKQAVSELEAFRDLTGSSEQHPVLADCYRALGRHAKVAELWEELRQASPSAALVAEGRIVYAGSLADQGRLADAIDVLTASKAPNGRPRDHHLRVTYALADLHERAGDVPKARQLFGVVAATDPEMGDVVARIRALD